MGQAGPSHAEADSRQIGAGSISAQHAAEYRQTLAKLKKDYVTAYISQHSKARLGVSEEKTKSALRKDSRLVAMRALTGISLMPTSQLTSFDAKLDKLKSCTALVESELAASPYCPHCSFRPANEQGEILPAANVLKQLDERAGSAAGKLAADPAGQSGRPHHPGKLRSATPRPARIDREVRQIKSAARPGASRLRQQRFKRRCPV